MTLSATQDIAIDAYTIETTHGRELGVANSVRIAAYRAASFVSSALLVCVAARRGWDGAFLAGAAITACSRSRRSCCRTPAADPSTPSRWRSRSSRC